MVSLLAAPVIVKYPMSDASGAINWGVVIIAVLLLAGTVWAIRQSQKEAPAAQ
jgi:cbb3-type cytochrome oxidase subunit 3